MLGASLRIIPWFLLPGTLYNSRYIEKRDTFVTASMFCAFDNATAIHHDVYSLTSAALKDGDICSMTLVMSHARPLLPLIIK